MKMKEARQKQKKKKIGSKMKMGVFDEYRQLAFWP